MAFISQADNLARGDTNGSPDVFVFDRTTETTTLVSATSSGSVGNGGAIGRPAISSDGAVVAFTSSASNLVAGDTNGLADVFVRTRDTASTRLVSADTTVGPANGASGEPAISADGRLVAFSSDASDLVAGDTNTLTDVFVRNLTADTTIRVSVGASGTQLAGGRSVEPAISADGRTVAFRVAGDHDRSWNAGDSQVYVRDLAGSTNSASLAPTAGGAPPGVRAGLLR